MVTRNSPQPRLDRIAQLGLPVGPLRRDYNNRPIPRTIEWGPLWCSVSRSEREFALGRTGARVQGVLMLVARYDDRLMALQASEWAEATLKIDDAEYRLLEVGEYPHGRRRYTEVHLSRK